MDRDLRTRVAAGVAGGLIGTLAMSVFQGWWSRAIAGHDHQSSGGDHDARGWQERSEDQNANEVLANRIAVAAIDRRLTPSELAVAAPAVHYAFGAAMGAVYGAFASKSDDLAPFKGAAFGTALWVAADEIAIPAFHLSKADAEYPLDVHVQAFASHLVYGIATELGFRGVRALLMS